MRGGGGGLPGEGEGGGGLRFDWRPVRVRGRGPDGARFGVGCAESLSLGRAQGSSAGAAPRALRMAYERWFLGVAAETGVSWGRKRGGCKDISQQISCQ